MSCFLNTTILMFLLDFMTRLHQVNYVGFSFKKNPFPRCYSHTTAILVQQKYSSIFISLCSVPMGKQFGFLL